VSNGDTFPRQYARTRRLTLGDPRDLRMSPDGASVLFLRSRSGTDPLTCLWAIDTASGHERLIVDPTSLGTSTEQMTDAERARRERLRESAEGITSFDCDRSMQRAVFAVDGRAIVCELASGQCTVIDIEGSVFDPRLSPDGQRCAMVRHGRLLVVDVAPETIASGATPPVLLDLGEDQADVNAPVAEWDLTDPATPWKPARTMRYPAAGTENALVGLYLVAVDGSSVIPIRWDSQAFPYLARVVADEYGPLLAVQSRDQRQLAVLRADEAGTTRVVHHDRDEHHVCRSQWCSTT
jgi:dipeptidyl-peptidase-4